MARVRYAHELTNRGLVSRALKQVNDIRIALAIGEGKIPRLPKGVPSDSKQCVLARALSNGWTATVAGVVTLKHPKEGVDWTATRDTLELLGFQHVKLTHNRRYNVLTFQLTDEMDELISRFDTRRMPHLILEGN